MSQTGFVLGTGTGLEIIVHHVDITTAGATVATACAPIVSNTVAEVHAFGIYRIGIFLGVVTAPIVTGTVETRHTVVQMSQEIMMERGILATPNTAITVSPLGVAGIAQRLGDGAPLHGEVLVVVERSHLVATPRHRTMVENDVATLTTPNSIGTVVYVFHLTATKTDKSNNHVVGRAVDGTITQGDAGRRCRLSGNGDVAVLYLNIRLQVDITGHIENDGTRAALAQSFAQ